MKNLRTNPLLEDLFLEESVLEEALFASKSKLSLLITGETGTGKSLLARRINASCKEQGAFIPYQASARSLDLIASELFGYKKGAFTGANADHSGILEEAKKACLFIDEIDALSFEAQNLLLSALQEKRYRRIGEIKERETDFRLITASNKPFEKLIKDGILREDFFHRISQLQIELPPLRENKERIEKIALRELEKLEKTQLGPKVKLSDKVLEKLLTYNWPGNIRELEHCIRQAFEKACFYKRSCILVEDLKIKDTLNKEAKSDNFRDKIRAYELELITCALEKNNGNESRAAKQLQLDRSTLRRILARYSQRLETTSLDL